MKNNKNKVITQNYQWKTEKGHGLNTGKKLMTHNFEKRNYAIENIKYIKYIWNSISADNIRLD